MSFRRVWRKVVSVVLVINALLPSAFAQKSDSYKASGSTRVDACKAAKDQARAFFDGRTSMQRTLNMSQRIKVGDCDCNEEKIVSLTSWVCMVDVELIGVDSPALSGISSGKPKGSPSGVRSDEAKGPSQQEACVDAKNMARRVIDGLGGVVKSYGSCICSFNGAEMSMYRWQCMVDTAY